MRRPGVLAMYRSALASAPSEGMDARILTAARERQQRATLTRPLLFASAAGLAAIFLLRWSTPPSPAALATDFGIAEGHASAYLTTFDPYKPTGPGSQEGLP